MVLPILRNADAMRVAADEFDEVDAHNAEAYRHGAQSIV